jgi:hypothetical protein
MTYFYISFATDEGFRGGTVVQADDAKGAVMEATTRGLNPGGEAAIMEVPPEAEFEPDILAMVNKLLGRDEIEQQGGQRLGDLSEDMQEAVQGAAGFVCDDCNPVTFISPPRS